jgi:hypothetical protein
VKVDKATLRRNRLKLVLLALLFFGPALLAWVLILLGWRPAGSTNHGQLVQPPIPIETAGLAGAAGGLDEAAFKGHWTMLLVMRGPCGDECLQMLDQSARVHIALNRNMDRLTRVLVLPERVAPPQGLQGVAVLSADVAQLERWTNGAPGAVQLVDPAGFRMMSYPLPLDGRGVLKDLERLLRVSKRDIERQQGLVGGIER